MHFCRSYRPRLVPQALVSKPERGALVDRERPRLLAGFRWTTHSPKLRDCNVEVFPDRLACPFSKALVLHVVRVAAPDQSGR